MDEIGFETGSDTASVTLPEQRACSRCEGTQHLVATDAGFGKYRCERCEMVVGFDLESEAVEFLLHRGLASRYTKNWFGARLAPQERRLTRAVPAETS